MQGTLKCRGATGPRLHTELAMQGSRSSVATLAVHSTRPRRYLLQLKTLAPSKRQGAMQKLNQASTQKPGAACTRCTSRRQIGAPLV